jgi:hypothetical protein
MRISTVRKIGLFPRVAEIIDGQARRKANTLKWMDMARGALERGQVEHFGYLLRQAQLEMTHR